MADRTQQSELERFQRAFTAVIRDPDRHECPPEIPAERMALYSRLIYGNIERVMSNMFPVLKSRVEDAYWQRLVRAFFRDYPLHDPLFQTMPGEFVSYLQARAPTPEDPPWLLELAHYEWVDYALGVDETELDSSDVDRNGDLLDGCPVVNPLTWMLSYQFPVHRFRDEVPSAQVPSAPTYLVASRGRDDRVTFLELNALAARLLERLDENPQLTGHSQLTATAHDLGHQPSVAFTDSGRAMLARLLSAEVILGTRCYRPFTREL